MIDWCLTPNLSVFHDQLYRGVKKFYKLISSTT